MANPFLLIALLVCINLHENKSFTTELLIYSTKNLRRIDDFYNKYKFSLKLDFINKQLYINTTMMKKILKSLQYMLLLSLAAGLTLTMSCSDDEDSAPTSTIMEVIRNDSNLDSLQKYLEVYPDLVALLESDGDRTVFAPSNSAFDALLNNTPGFPSDITTINPDIIKNVLAYHVSPTRYESGSLTAGVSITTASQGGEKIIVNDDGRTLFTGSSNPEIAIFSKDIKATNGVLHTVGSVLIPPSVGATLTPNLGKVSGVVLLGADFTILTSAILKADTFATGAGKPTLLSILAGGTTDDMTLFAPSNGTFISGNLTAASFTGEKWYDILATHVVQSKIEAADLTLGETFTAVSEATITVVSTDAATDPAKGINTGIVIDADDPTNANRAQVAVPSSANADALEKENGIVHIIAGVLIPPAAEEEVEIVEEIKQK